MPPKFTAESWLCLSKTVFQKNAELNTSVLKGGNRRTLQQHMAAGVSGRLWPVYIHGLFVTQAKMVLTKIDPPQLKGLTGLGKVRFSTKARFRCCSVKLR